jgi:hypothetical protein
VEAVELVAELGRALLDELTVEIGILVHGCLGETGFETQKAISLVPA